MSVAPVGRRLAGFTIEGELGRGGMGLVLRARQESLDRTAVLNKILEELVVQHPELEARFEREAHAAARLHHPNVVAVYDRFRHRGAHYIATEYVDGVDLASLLEKEGALPWRIAAGIALEIARGLEAIHAEGMLHRDLKPQNLLIGRRGEVKVADFGLVLDSSGTSLTQPGIALGTPPYMAPEQLRGERVDPRADLFAFGCVLYEMLVGRTPFEMPAEGEHGSLLARVESGRYRRLGARPRPIPRPLRAIVRRCLKPRASRRIASATELRRRLESLLDRPSSVDLRRGLASWLWERRVFETRENETVVMVAPEAGVRRRMRWRLTLATAGLVGAASLLGFSVRHPAQIADWSERVVRRAVFSTQETSQEPIEERVGAGSARRSES